MSHPTSPHPVEIFAVNEGPEQRALVALTRPDGVLDVPGDALVGAVTLANGLPDWNSLELMERFKGFYGAYMRGERRVEPDLLRAAQVKPGEYVYVIDGRIQDPQGEVEFHDIVGWYQSDDQGRAIADTFEYNPDHRVVSEGVPSSMLVDPSINALAYGGSGP